MPFISIYRSRYLVSEEVLRLILNHNDPSIRQLAFYFEAATGSKLDEKILESKLDDMTKKIAVHAVRTAQDLTYRDLMLLNDVIGRPGSDNPNLSWALV